MWHSNDRFECYDRLVLPQYLTWGTRSYPVNFGSNFRYAHKGSNYKVTSCVKKTINMQFTVILRQPQTKRKQMFELWKESAKFDLRIRRLVDQVRMILYKELFSMVKILEIHEQVNRKENIRQEPPKWSTTQNLKNPNMATQVTATATTILTRGNRHFKNEENHDS